MAEREDIKRAVGELLEHLRPQERFVLASRFCLGDGEERSLALVGELPGVSRERVRQVEKSAVNKLKLRWQEVIALLR